MLKRHAATLARIEQRFGVPGPVLVAIWGLETDFGAVRGNLPVIRSVATLAFDCRRTEFFQAHLFDALRIVDRGDLTPAEMRGVAGGALTPRCPTFESGCRIQTDHCVSVLDCLSRVMDPCVSAGC